MPNEPGRPDDPWSRASWRRLIAWEKRIQREAPFLARALGDRRADGVLDLGCGSGEHVAWFAEQGVRAVGLDRSRSMIESARDHERAGRGRFVEGEIADAPGLLASEAPFGLVICLGNVLPYVDTPEALDRFFEVAAALLVPGGRLLVQILAYDSLRARGQRALPVNVRPGETDEEEIVFLRLLTFLEDDRVVFVPATFGLDVDADPPLRMETCRRVEVRGWTDRHLVPRATAHGFEVELYGDMEGGAYDPRRSHDLVLLATKRA
ncbi:MAG: class I SAM-dependent methyltransferase [Planctomycetota bacterium]